MEEIIQRYVKKHGNKAKEVPQYLAKEQPFIEAISSEMGAQIMSMIIEDTNNSLKQFMDKMSEGVSPTELVTINADYQAGLRFIKRVQNRINNYSKYKIKEAVG